MVIVIRPIPPTGNDFFKEGGCIAIFQRSALRPLLWTPQSAPSRLPALHGTPQASPSSSSTSAPPETSTSTPSPPPARRASENIGASFNCICYEWTKGRTVTGTVVIWVGHGAKSTGPANFPGIRRFRQLAYFCQIAAKQHDPMQETLVRTATPSPINRILFLSCYALNWVTAHLPDFFAEIATPQNTDLRIDASNLKVHNGSIGEILRNLSDPRSLSVLAQLKLTRTAEPSAERFSIRLTVGNYYVFGPAMLEEVLINYTSMIQRGWRTAAPLVYLKFRYRPPLRSAAAPPPAEHRLPPLTGTAH